MCGRFALVHWTALADVFGLDEVAPEPPRYNLAPTQSVAVITNEARRRLDRAVWGLIPSWAKDRSVGARMINARAETLAEKPSFKTAFQRRRCLVLADGFYEWRRIGRTRQPILFRCDDEVPFAFAGLFERWKSPDGAAILSCTIVTTTANDLVAPLHDRMPVIVAPTDYDRWLAPTPQPPDALRGLLVPYPSEAMRALEVSPYVNDVRHEGAACWEPAGPTLFSTTD